MKRDPQLNLFAKMRKKNKVVSELEAISHILDDTRPLLDRIYQDLCPTGGLYTGRPGLNAGQSAALCHFEAIPGIDLLGIPFIWNTRNF